MPSVDPVARVPLSDGNTMPSIGLGLWRVHPAEGERVVDEALSVGYRSFDTASKYGNEAAVGRALRRSALARADLFVTGKVWNTDHGRAATHQACRRSLDEVGTHYFDLYLIHWPCRERGRFVETFEALIELQQSGLVRSIGVSNFELDDLRSLISHTGVIPAVNQVELHPHFQQSELRTAHAVLGIATEAYSPLGAGKGVLSDRVLTSLAAAYGVTCAQVALRWSLELGNIVIPKTNSAHRMAQNLDVFGFQLSEQDMTRLRAIDGGVRTGLDPAHVN